jgi:hypothetical protein
MSAKPVRIQRRRAKGYDMQAVSRATNGLDCISVTRPGRWGNPYDVKVFGRELSLKLFRESIEGSWDPALLDGHSDELCDAAYAAHMVFNEAFSRRRPADSGALRASRLQLRVLLQHSRFLP